MPQANGRHRQLAEGHGRDDGDSRHHQLHALRAVLRAAHAVDAQVVPRFGRVRGHGSFGSIGRVLYATGVAFLDQNSADQRSSPQLKKTLPIIVGIPFCVLLFHSLYIPTITIKIVGHGLLIAYSSTRYIVSFLLKVDFFSEELHIDCHGSGHYSRVNPTRAF